MTWKAAHLLAAMVAVAATAEAAYLIATTDSLAAHMVTHVLLVDVAAAAIVLAVPIHVRRALAAAIDRHAEGSAGLPALGARLSRSPLGLLVTWTLVLSVLMLPAGHQWSITPAGRVFEPLVLLLLGIGFWRVTFDEHSLRPLDQAVLRGGLAWWARHVLAMVGRVAILPAILALWFWPAGAYSGADAAQQELAAGVILGAEMTIFGIAFVLFFILFTVLGQETALPPHRVEAADGL